MKRFLRRNIVVIIILLVFGVFFLYGDYQVIQNNQDIVELTNNLQEQCKTKVITDEEEKKFCHEILTNRVIEPDFYSEYSLGMKQKLGIAQVLTEDSDIIILDEPFNGIENESVKKISRILKEEKEKGKLIIISTHIKEDLDNLSDFIYYFDAGEVHTK